MPRIKKFAPKLTTNLTNIQTFLLDTVYESEYFKITEFKDTLTGGKNGFLIEGSEYLKESTEIKIEILDSAGNPIYYEAERGNPQYYETTSILVAIYVYNTTPVGPAKITILGEAKTYNDTGIVRNVPDEWKGVYNVKWERSFKVNGNLPNIDRVRFKYRPTINVNELSGSVYLTQITEVVQSGIANGYPITPEVGTVLSNKYYGDLLYKVIKSGSGITKVPAINRPFWESGNTWDVATVFDFYLLEKCDAEEGDTNVYYLSNPTSVFGIDLLDPIIPYKRALNLKIGDDIPQTYLLRGIMKLDEYDESLLTPVTSTGAVGSVDITSPTYPFVYGCSDDLNPGILPPLTISTTNSNVVSDVSDTFINTNISVIVTVANVGGFDEITATAYVVPPVPQEVIINTSIVYSVPMGGILSFGLNITVPPSSATANSSPYPTGETSISILNSCVESHTQIDNANVIVTSTTCAGFIPQPIVAIPNQPSEPTEPVESNDGGKFPGQSILGAIITIPSASIYNEPIYQFFNDTEIIIQTPYVIDGSVDIFNEFDYTLTYNVISDFATSSLASSYGNFRINNLNTAVGDVSRVKIFYKPTRDITQYILLDDIKIESTELLKEEFSGSFVEYGNFTSSYTDYWITGSNPNYTVSASNSTVFAGLKVERISETTESFQLQTSESFSVFKGEEYTFYTNIQYSGELNEDVYFRAYLSGSSFYSGSQQDIVILNPIPQNKNQQRLETNVIIRETGDYHLIIDVFGDEWDFGAVSLKSSQEEYYSPDYVEFNIPIARTRTEEYFDFKFEFYDINNNYIPTDIFVNKILFKEGKITLPINGNDLTEVIDDIIDDINDIKGEISNKPIYKYGEILFGTGTTIISQSANLYWDIPNNRLGIGTKNPQYDVDISGNVRITENLIVEGRVTAQEFYTEYISSSVIYESGSTKFGDSDDDVHERTGSLLLKGNQIVTGSVDISGGMTASLAPGHVWIGNGSGRNIQVSTSSILPTVSAISPIVVEYDSNTRNYEISHTESGVSPGTYNSVTVDEYGHVTTASLIPTPTYGVGELLFGDESGLPTSSVNIYYNTQSGVVQINGSVEITGGITASLQEGYIWIGDVNGQNIQVSTSSILPTVSGVSPISVSYNSDTRNYEISHTESGVTPGTYNSVTVDEYGHVTTASLILEPVYGVGELLFGDENGIPTSSANIYYNTQSGVVQITGSVDITNGITASLQEGYIWVGNNAGRNIQIPTSSISTNQNNFVRVLTIPSSYIDFSQPIKPQIVEYINNITPLIIAETDSKWDIVIYYDLETNQITSTTEINLWFDNSGSMPETFKPLVDMVGTCLRELLIGIYNNDDVLYNQRVKVRTFQSTSGIGNLSPYVSPGNKGVERTFSVLNTTGSLIEITQVINLVFQDEADNQGYYDDPFDGTTSPLDSQYTTNYVNDIQNLKNTLNSIPNESYYKGVVYQITNGLNTNFKKFLEATTGSLYPSYSGIYGLSDEISSGLIKYEYNITENGSPDYYLNLISQSFASFGYTNIGNTAEIVCGEVLLGSVQTICTDYTGTNGRIDVVSVSGGSGTGYYFTINDDLTQYPTGSGNGANSLSNGSYIVTLFDDDDNFVNLGTFNINCQPLVGTISVSCDDTSGNNGSIDVISVSGGTGVPYYFTITGSGEYNVGATNGANNVTDGTYSIVLFDSGSINSISLGDAVVDCYVAPSNYIINVYECDGETQIGTGRIAPFGNLGDLTGLYVQVTDNESSLTRAGLITGGTNSNAPTHTITGEATFGSIELACIA